MISLKDKNGKIDKIKLVYVLIFGIIFFRLLLISADNPTKDSFPQLLGQISNQLKLKVLNQTGAEENINIEIHEINETASRICVGFGDKDKYSSELSKIGKDIKDVPVETIGLKKDKLKIDKTKLDLSEATDVSGEQCFEVAYDELEEGMELKIGWESVLIGVALDTALVWNSNENILTDENGVKHIAFRGANNHIYYGNNSGGSWSTRDLGGAIVNMVNILERPDGTLVIIYLDGIYDYYSMNSTDKGGTWSSPYNFASGGNSQIGASCGMDSNGIAHCCFLDASADAVYYVNTSSEVVETVNDNGADDTDKCDIEIASNGCVYIVGVGTDQDDVDIWSPCLDGWGDANRVEVHASTTDNNPSIAIANDNTIYLAWEESSDLWFGNSSDGGATWSTKELDADATYRPDIGVSTAGDIFILYEDATNVYRANSSDLGVTWETRTTLNAHGGSTAVTVSLADSNYPKTNRIDGTASYLFDNSTDLYYDNFSVRTPSIGLKMIYPTTNINVTSNAFFNVSINVSCNMASCGVINVSLDPEPKIEYTSTTDTICNGGTCTKNIYSGIRNVYEDNQWKRIEDARSLKGSGINCVVDYDGEHIAECLDWNATSIKLRLKIKDDKNKNKEIPIKVFGTAIDEATGQKIKEEKTDKKQNVKFNSLSEEKEIIIDANYGDEIHFGESSTIIYLNSSSSDGYVYNSNSNWATSHDATTGVGVNTNNNNGGDNGAEVWMSPPIPTSKYYIYRSFLYFNTSEIPDDVNIEDAMLSIYGGGGAGTTNLTIQKGNQSDTLSTSDYASFSGDTYGIYVDTPSSVNNYTFNQQGREDINLSGITKLCLRDYKNDYLNTSSGASSTIDVVFYYSEYIAYPPVLTVTYNFVKSGLVNTTTGATPFYTNSTNPLSTSSLTNGQSQVITFWVNATGTINQTYENWFAFANVTSDLSISNISSLWNVTIVEGGGAPPANTCSPTSPLSANHQYECSDSCNITSNLNANGFNITINGTGNIVLKANITNYSFMKLYGQDSSNKCNITCATGCF